MESVIYPNNPVTQEVRTFLTNHKQFQAEDWFDLTMEDLDVDAQMLLGLMLIAQGKLKLIATNWKELDYDIEIAGQRHKHYIGTVAAYRDPITLTDRLTIPLIKLLHTTVTREGSDPTSLMFKKKIAEEVIKY